LLDFWRTRQKSKNLSNACKAAHPLTSRRSFYQQIFDPL